MLATNVFIALLVVDIALIFVAFFARGNLLFADILAAVGAAFLSWYLALVTLGGNVGEQVLLPATTTGNLTALSENITGSIMTAEYQALTTTTVDPSFGLFISGLAAIMTIVAFALAIDYGLTCMQEV
jgi:hypothetical protein